ncbi:MAG: ComF family protein [Sciscionella sp.]
MFLAAIALHGSCVEQRLGENIDVWASVPSTRADRAGEHPLRILVRQANLEHPEIELAASTSFDGNPRATGRGRFTVNQPDTVTGRHVLLIEDTWTTGSHCQSAALALRQAGAVSVTAVVLARWLNPEHPPTAEFIKSHLVDDYNPPCLSARRSVTRATATRVAGPLRLLLARQWHRLRSRGVAG